MNTYTNIGYCLGVGSLVSGVFCYLVFEDFQLSIFWVMLGIGFFLSALCGVMLDFNTFKQAVQSQFRQQGVEL